MSIQSSESMPFQPADDKRINPWRGRRVVTRVEFLTLSAGAFKIERRIWEGPSLLFFAPNDPQSTSVAPIRFQQWSTHRNRQQRMSDSGSRTPDVIDKFSFQ